MPGGIPVPMIMLFEPPPGSGTGSGDVTAQQLAESIALKPDLHDGGLPPPNEHAAGTKILAVENGALLSFVNQNRTSWRATSAIPAAGGALDLVITPIPGDGTATSFTLAHGLAGRVADCYVRRVDTKRRLVTPTPEQVTGSPGEASVEFGTPPGDGTHELVTIGETS